MNLSVTSLSRQDVTGQVNFNSHTDIVVRMAVALVNLLTDGEERGRKYVPPAVAERTARLNALFEVGRQQDRSHRGGSRGVRWRRGEAAGRLHRRRGGGHRRRGAPGERHAEAPPARTPCWKGTTARRGTSTSMPPGRQSRVSGWAAGCATGLAIVLGGEHFDRLGVCTAPHCDRVYVDTSRNGSKRFCSTACQNRVKTAAFREARQSRPLRTVTIGKGINYRALEPGFAVCARRKPAAAVPQTSTRMP